MSLKLSPNEIRDITKLLEAGKPLPEKYRFVLFGENRNIELVWEGKTNAITDAQLPFQIIEQVDEPRSEKAMQSQMGLFDSSSGRQLKGWSNKLIWGENKFIISSLRVGPLREEIEKNGGIKLIYIDPPFDVGADFKIDIEIGDEVLEKTPSILEEIAYRDTWGKGRDSFAQMIRERLILMHSLLANDGSIFVHCDWRVSHIIKSIMNEIFYEENFVNEIMWKRRQGKTSPDTNRLENAVDHILFYRKSADHKINFQFTNHGSEDYIKNSFTHKDEDGRLYQLTALNAPKPRPTLVYDFMGYKPHPNGWSVSRERLQEYYEANKLVFPKNKDGRVRRKQYLDEWKGYAVDTLWDDINVIASQSSERTGYPTQKPESLLERIIKLASEEGDIVADFFSGSGTTAIVSEKLNRKWIASDIGKFSIHTTRKRLIELQRYQKKNNLNWRAFELLNLGKYEKGMLLSNHTGLDIDDFNDEIQHQKDKIFEKLILQAYGAQEVSDSAVFVGAKFNRMISIGPINLPVTRLFVEAVIEECQKNRITKADILAFEYEMGLFPNIQDEARKLGVDIAFKYIPRDIFDKRAVESGQVKFHDVAYIEVKVHLNKNILSIELADYSVGYQQDSIDSAEKAIGKSGIKIVVENGQVVKVEKNKDGIFSRSLLTKSWSDWIDYWAIDWDFANRKEIVNVKNSVTGAVESKWTGDFIFENEWQSFRTRKDRSLELTSVARELPFGKRKIAIKVVDIFGNDTMKIIDIDLGNV